MESKFDRILIRKESPDIGAQALGDTRELADLNKRLHEAETSMMKSLAWFVSLVARIAL